MANFLTDLGEEYLIKNSIDGDTLTVGLYNDSTDSLSDTSDIADITSEPSGSYSRQTATFNSADLSGNWGVDNDAEISFDTSTSTETVDHYFLAVSFQAEDTGDSASNLHLLGVRALSESRDLSQIDALNIAAGDAGLTVD